MVPCQDGHFASITLPANPLNPLFPTAHDPAHAARPACTILHPHHALRSEVSLSSAGQTRQRAFLEKCGDEHPKSVAPNGHEHNGKRHLYCLADVGGFNMFQF